LIGLGLITAVFGQYVLYLFANKANLGRLTLTGTLFVVRIIYIIIYMFSWQSFWSLLSSQHSGSKWSLSQPFGYYYSCHQQFSLFSRELLSKLTVQSQSTELKPQRKDKI